MNGLRWRCPRCGEIADPRTCTCMRALRRHLDDAAHEITMGRPLRAERKLAEARSLLTLLGLDADKAAGRGPQGGRAA